jgi:hypothetical protein
VPVVKYDMKILNEKFQKWTIHEFDTF